MATTGTCGRKKPIAPARTGQHGHGPEPVEHHRARLELRQRVRAARLGEQVADALGRLARRGRATARPAPRGTTRPPRRRRACSCPPRAAPDHGHDRERGRRRRRRCSTDTRRKSRNLTARRAPPARSRMPSMPSTTRSACSTISRGPSSERTPTRTGTLDLAQRLEGVEVGHVVARVQRGPHRPAGEQLAHRAALADRHGRPDLQHLPAPVRPQPLRLGLLGDARARGRGPPPRRARRASGRS